MLTLGRAFLLVVAVIAGLGVLVDTARWLEWREHGTAMPPGTEIRCLFFALALGGALLIRHELRRLQRANQALELLDAREGQAFEARGGLGWFALALPLCLFFGFCAYAAIQKGHLGMAAVSLTLLAVIGLLAWQVALQVLRPGPMLRMDRGGIDHAMYGPIAWAEVIGMELRVIRMRRYTQYTLMLGVRGAAGYLRNAPPLIRWLHGHRVRHREVGALPMPLNLLAKDPFLVHDAARALRRATRAPFLDHWHARMDDQEVRALLHVQELDAESRQIDRAMAALPRNVDPARRAALESRRRGHRAREAEALPQVRTAMRKHLERRRSDLRGAWVVAAFGLTLLLVSLALRFLP